VSPLHLARDPLVWLAVAFVALVALLPHAGPVVQALAPENAKPIYDRQSFAALALSHLWLVSFAAIIAIVLGTGGAILVTRPFARDFRAVAEGLVALGQTVPPIAVLGLAVPLIGFGAVPTIVALTLYGLLPVLQTTLAALDSTPPAAVEAARGMGLSPRQILTRVELPLAAPLIMAGIRSSVVIAIGTATVGSIVGATSLGDPIIAGLVNGNTAYVVEGCIVVALLAILVDALLGRVEQVLSESRSA
jgi:osmoprotectant transport system permease protein